MADKTNDDHVFDAVERLTQSIIGPVPVNTIRRFVWHNHKISYDQTFAILKKLVAKDKLIKPKRGYYDLPQS